MFEALRGGEICKLLESYLRHSSRLEPAELEELLHSFPFREHREGLNPNLLALKVFRKRRDLVSAEDLARRLGVSRKTAEEILRREPIETLFPVSDGERSRLVKTFLIPLNAGSSFSLEVEGETLRILERLTGKRFFLSFDRLFDPRTQSFMLSVYAGLRYGSRVRALAFTGRLSPEGSVEGVRFLEEKLTVCAEEGIPLLFPSEDLRSLEDLHRFVESLVIPVGFLPGVDPHPFRDAFDFSEEYLRRVFHIEEPLVWSEEFPESAEAFSRLNRWIEGLSLRLKNLREKHIDFRVGFSSRIVAASFLAGVRLSKARLPVIFLRHEDSSYRELYLIETDRVEPEAPEELIDVKVRGKVREIRIHTKGDPLPEEGVMSIRTPAGEALDARVLETAASINRRIRPLRLGCVDLHLETSNALSFALGYLLEDYQCFRIFHRGKLVYVLRPSDGERIPYLLNAFSLNMIESSRAFLEIEELPIPEALEELRGKGFVSFVSHGSTAEVLSRMLGREVRVSREPLRLRQGDVVLVFQLRVRPREGQVFTEEEIRRIVEENRFTFFRVRVHS